MISHPGKLSLAIRSWELGRRNEYQTQGGDALQLEGAGKGRYGSCVVAGKTV